jgi:hypothetical protein
VRDESLPNVTEDLTCVAVHHKQYMADIDASFRAPFGQVDPMPFFQKCGANTWAAVKGELDAVTAGMFIDPTGQVSIRTRTSICRCAGAGRRGRVPGSDWEAERAATGTRGDRPRRARRLAPPRAQL